jgi:hypothetical protein
MRNRLPTRRTDIAKVRAAPEESQSQPVKLRIAASMLHQERSGRRRDSMRGPEYIERLNEAAAALGGVADIYRLEAGGALLRIPKEELDRAQYLDGGNVLRTAAGALYHPLAMRRAEAIGAITLLASAKAEVPLR